MATKRQRATSNLPIDMSAQLAAEAEAIASRIAAPSGDRILAKGNAAFTTPDGMTGDELQVVIVDFISVNLFYPNPYDPDNIETPTCFAFGPEPSALVPSKNSPTAEAASCATCPNNQFGSALVGKGKACKNTRLLAVVDPEKEDADIWVLAVPPSSLKAFDSYVKLLSIKHGTVPIGVVTSVTLDPGETYFSPRFAVERLLDNKELEPIFQRRDEAMDRLMTEPDTSTVEAPAPKKAPRRRRN